MNQLEERFSVIVKAKDARVKVSNQIMFEGKKYIITSILSVDVTDNVIGKEPGEIYLSIEGLMKPFII